MQKTTQRTMRNSTARTATPATQPAMMAAKGGPSSEGSEEGSGEEVCRAEETAGEREKRGLRVTSV